MYRCAMQLSHSLRWDDTVGAWTCDTCPDRCEVIAALHASYDNAIAALRGRGTERDALNAIYDVVGDLLYPGVIAH
jgi:hypothetical protein